MLEEGGKSARLLAGGTDLVGVIWENILPDEIKKIISLKDVAPLTEISRQDDGSICIGSMVTLSEIASNDSIAGIFPALAEAAKNVASPQIRNVATIGGNVCQEPRCWYYRYPGNKFHCMRKGGLLCNAITGRNEYHSVFGPCRVKEAPCEAECPNGTPVPEYIGEIKNGDIEAACWKLFSANPLAAVTGRVCPHTCETVCSLNETDSPVSARNIERYIGDFILDHIDDYFKAAKRKSGKKAAIIGTGPAGLTAAFKLIEYGHDVTMIDKNRNIGGMLYYGIPSHRLPKDILERIKNILESKGVKFKMGTEVGGGVGLDEIKNEYDAVLVANGACKAAELGCEGEELEGVMSGIGFLGKIAEGEGISIGRNVAVIGGGNTAMDACTAAKRLGAENVTVYYRRSRGEMPAEPDEIADAEKAGVVIKNLVSPVLIRETGRAKEIILQKMELGEPDESGRRRPVALKGWTESVQADMIIVAAGQNVDPAGFEAVYSGKGVLDADPETGITKIPGVYAAGDSVNGAATAIKAICGARKAAASIHDFLTGSTAAEPYAAEMYITKGGIEGTRNKNTLPETISFEASRCMNCGCVAASPSDIAVALLALNAVIVTDRRRIPAGEFFYAGIGTSTVLDKGELVVSIEIPHKNRQNKQAYEKYRTRTSIDFPIVSIAVSMDIEDDVVVEPRIALGAVYPTPLRMTEVEEYLDGKALDRQTILKASEIIVEKAEPLAENRHKITAVSVIFKRMLERLIYI